MLGSLGLDYGKAASLGLCVFNLEAAGGRRRPRECKFWVRCPYDPPLATIPDLVGSLSGPRGLLSEQGGDNSQLTSVPPAVPNLTPSLTQLLSLEGLKVWPNEAL